jgi:hypothetical protein
MIINVLGINSVAVGMPITRHPPRRSRRAMLLHRALAFGCDAKLFRSHVACIVSSMFAPVTVYRSQANYTVFPLATSLPSRTSAISHSILFGSFSGTMLMSDFSDAFMSGLYVFHFPRPILILQGYI